MIRKGWHWYWALFSYHLDWLTGDKCQTHMWLIVTWDRDNMKRCTRRPTALSRRVWVLSITQWWTITHNDTWGCIHSRYNYLYSYTHTAVHWLILLTRTWTKIDEGNVWGAWWGDCWGNSIWFHDCRCMRSQLIWKVTNNQMTIQHYNQTLDYQVGTIFRNEFFIF